MTQFDAKIVSYDDAKKYLGNKMQRKIGHNTWVRQHPWSSCIICICYHNTDVVQYHQDGSIRLYTGGYHTPTTKARINAFTPDEINVWQQNFEWFVCSPGCPDIPFTEGFTFVPQPKESR